MTLIASLANLLSADAKLSFLGLVLIYLAYRVTTFYSRVYSLPPGPLPLPFVGNMFALHSSNQNWSVVLAKIADSYGPVFTVWYGETPTLYVTDIDLLRDTFKKNEFAGRPQDLMVQLFLKDNRHHIVFEPPGNDWDALKRVSHAAVVRYAVSEKLNDLVIDCVDHTVDLMVKTEGLNKPFVPFEYIFNMIFNIMAASAFGHRYDPDDPEYKFYVYTQVKIYEDYGNLMRIWESLPITRFGEQYRKFCKIWDDLADLFITKFANHYKDYNENVIRDFCDTLIAAKNEAIKKSEESKIYLSDSNLAMAVSDLLLAGIDTTHITTIWIVLHMLYKNEFLAKLRHEIDVEIGDRMPTHEDKSRCHYVMAFIMEVMRHSPGPPIQLPHKTVVTTQLGGYTIPKGTVLFGFTGYMYHQDQHFSEPNIFRPERFLDCNGHYVETKHKAFIPFGVGRRKCLGDKMALNVLFLVLVRFVQMTDKYRIGFHATDKQPILYDPKAENFFNVPPKEFQISLNII